MSAFERKTIYLHVGTTKTGSTTIQQFLRQNERVFMEHGVGIYIPKGVSAKDDPQRLRTLVQYLALLNVHFPTARFLSKWYRRFLCELEEHPARSLILSEECLWDVIGAPRKRRNFKRFIGHLQCFADVKIVVYVRRQDHFLMSAYQQNLKDGNMNGLSCMEWMGTLFKSERTDYKVCLQWIRDLVGQENLIVRPFESSQFVDQSLISDFLQCVGADVKELFERPSVNRNPGLSPFLAEVIRCLSYFYNGKGYVRPFMQLKKGRDERYFNFDRNHRFLSPAQRNQIIERYAEGNRWVATELLGRPDGVLFYELAPDLAEKWSEFRLSENEVKRFFVEQTYIPAAQRDKMCRQVLSVCRNGVSQQGRFFHGVKVVCTRLIRKIYDLIGVIEPSVN